MTKRSAIALRPSSWSKLTILPWVSRFFDFSHDKTPNLMVFSEISFWNEMFLCPIKTEVSTFPESMDNWLSMLNRNWFSSCKRRELRSSCSEEKSPMVPNPDPKTNERMTCHCFLRPIRRDHPSSFCTTHLLQTVQRRQQETSRRFCETLVSHMFFKCDEMSYSTALTVKTMLVFLEYIFQFFINKALPAPNSVHRQNFMGKKC